MASEFDIFAALRESDDYSDALIETNRALLSDPLPLFQRLLAMLLELGGKVDRPVRVKYPVELVLDTEHHADANSVRLGRRPRQYKITVNSGFFYLVNDVAELRAATSSMVAHDGREISPPDLTRDQTSAIMRDALREYVEFKNRWTPSEALVSNNQERTLREVRLHSTRRRDFIHFWGRQLVLVFVLGHELGHVVLGHLDPPSIFRRRHPPEVMELAADGIGAKFLIDFISVSPDWWVREWITDDDPRRAMILNGLAWNEVQSNYKSGDFAATINSIAAMQRGDWAAAPIVPPYEIVLRQALSVIGALFVVLEGAERAAAELGAPRDSHYPPAAKRYEFFRRICIENLGIAEEQFSTFGGRQSAPDDQYWAFRDLVSSISWQGR